MSPAGSSATSTATTAGYWSSAGSHLDGKYRIASVCPATVRIPVLWTPIRTPLGATVDIESPGTGPLSESGVNGYVDNHCSETSPTLDSRRASKIGHRIHQHRRETQ